MAEGQSSEDKTEDPTPKRLEDARKKGNIPSSKELNTSIILMLGSTAMIMFGQTMLTGIGEIMSDAFAFKREQIFRSEAMLQVLGISIGKMIWLLLPLFVLLVLGSFVGPMLLSGFKLNFAGLGVKFNKLNPWAGLKRIFSVKGLVELVKALAKFIFIALIAMYIVWSQIDEIMNISNHDPTHAIFHGLKILAVSFIALTAITLLIAAVDVPFQLFQYMKSLRMTKQEVKDEYKEQEGSPEVKSHLRQMQRQVAEARMIQDVPTADVVITNPTHYAVALKYDTQGSGAPYMVAKGQDFIAEQIKKVAKHNEVPILSAPPLARSIYFTTEINQEIPQGLYVSVAQVLAYVYQLKRHKRGSGKRPEDLPDFEIPEDLQY